MVQRTLMWIAYAKEPLSLAALTEILSIEEGDSHIDPEAIMDGSAILVSCSSLIRTSDPKGAQAESLVEFSHFTVKEYLLELSSSGATEFRNYSLMAEGDARLEIAKLCLTYLNAENFSSSFPNTEEEELKLNKKYPFRLHAARWIEYRGHGHHHDESYLNLSRNLFDPSKSNNFICWAQALPMPENIKRSYEVQISNTSTLHWACIIADPMLCSYLVELNENVNKSSGVGAPLHCAILGPTVLTIHWENWSTDEDIIAWEATGGDRVEVIKLLLAAGANVNTLFAPNGRSNTIHSFTTFSLAFQCGPVENMSAVATTLLKGGTVCNRSALEYVLTRHNLFLWDKFMEEIKLQNLESEDITWFMGEYSKSKKRAVPALATEVQEAVEKDTGTIEAAQALLMTAAEFGQHEILTNLLGQSIINVNGCRSIDGNTSLHLCAKANHPQTVQLLLDAGADPLQCNDDQKISLHLAARHLDGLVFRVLLNITTDIDRRDNKGLTPLHEAACYGNTVVIKHLHERFGSTKFQQIGVTFDGRSLSTCASQSGSVDTLELLDHILGQSDIQKISLDGSSALHYATEAMSLPAVNYLLNKGLHANSLRMDGSTPLHIIAASTDTPTPHRRAIIELLLDRGADINACRADGATALSLLCEFGRMNDDDDDPDVLTILLEKACKIDKLDMHGRTPLHILCTRLAAWDRNFDSRSSAPTCAKTILELLKNGADVTVCDNQNQSSLQMIF